MAFIVISTLYIYLPDKVYSHVLPIWLNRDIATLNETDKTYSPFINNTLVYNERIRLD